MVICQGCCKEIHDKLCCPKCNELGRESFFCSQDCFISNWIDHAKLHKIIQMNSSNSPNFVFSDDKYNKFDKVKNSSEDSFSNTLKIEYKYPFNVNNIPENSNHYENVKLNMNNNRKSQDSIMDTEHEQEIKESSSKLNNLNIKNPSVECNEISSRLNDPEKKFFRDISTGIKNSEKKEEMKYEFPPSDKSENSKLSKNQLENQVMTIIIPKNNKKIDPDAKHDENNNSTKTTFQNYSVNQSNSEIKNNSQSDNDGKYQTFKENSIHNSPSFKNYSTNLSNYSHGKKPPSTDFGNHYSYVYNSNNRLCGITTQEFNKKGNNFNVNNQISNPMHDDMKTESFVSNFLPKSFLNKIPPINKLLSDFVNDFSLQGYKNMTKNLPYNANQRELQIIDRKSKKKNYAMNSNFVSGFDTNTGHVYINGKISALDTISTDVGKIDSTFSNRDDRRINPEFSGADKTLNYARKAVKKIQLILSLLKTNYRSTALYIIFLICLIFIVHHMRSDSPTSISTVPRDFDSFEVNHVPETNIGDNNLLSINKIHKTSFNKKNRIFSHEESYEIHPTIGASTEGLIHQNNTVSELNLLRSELNTDLKKITTEIDNLKSIVQNLTKLMEVRNSTSTSANIREMIEKSTNFSDTMMIINEHSNSSDVKHNISSNLDTVKNDLITDLPEVNQEYAQSIQRDGETLGLPGHLKRYFEKNHI